MVYSMHIMINLCLEKQQGSIQIIIFTNLHFSYAELFLFCNSILTPVKGKDRVNHVGVSD